MALKVILGLIGGLLVFLGGRWIFAPDGIMREHDISASSSTGRSHHGFGDIRSSRQFNCRW